LAIKRLKLESGLAQGHGVEEVQANQTAPEADLRTAACLTFPLAPDSTNVAVERVDLGEAAPINEAVALVCKRMSAGQFAAAVSRFAVGKIFDFIASCR